jgi:hypothetical protein
MAAATPALDLPTDRNPTSKSIFNSARAPKKTTYDLTPFLSCPAVIARSKKDAYPGYAPEIKVLPIPETAIPSPLAANLAPERIWSLKEFLCGKVTGDADGNGNANGGYGGNGGNERGKEIWLSWKRAWDLWNNHYIEGRVNPVWVAEEWKRREKKEKNAKRDRERKQRMGRMSGQRGGGVPDGDGEGSNLSLVGTDDEDVRRENGSDVVFIRGDSCLLGRVAEVPDLDSEEEVGRHGGHLMRRSDTGQEWGPLPPTAERKKWIKTECLHTNDSGEDRFDEEWEEVDESVEKRLPPSPPGGGGGNPPSPPPPPSDHSGPDPPDSNPKTKHIGHSDQGDDDDDDDDDDDGNDDYDDYDDDADIIVNHRTINRDGSSGGYYPIKDLADYRLPENDPISDTYSDWQDVTSNSVWRPRRIGEKKLKIDLDEDIEEFFKNSDMEVWGGVDCGRSPYPVRFAISQYVCIR